MTIVGRRLLVALVLTLGAVALLVGVAAPPERCPDLTADRTRTAASAAVGWIVGNQHPDGRWLYEYDRGTDTVSDDYNEVRHAGVMSSLYQAASGGHAGAIESADAGLQWALQHLVQRHDWIGLTDSDTVQTGSNALLLAALAERRAQTRDTNYDDLMAGLARFITSQTEPSGALLAYYDLGLDRPRADTYSIYYTGEAQWALARMHRLFPDDGWDEYSDRMLHYMATIRDDAEEVWPPLADHWSGYGLATTAAFMERPTGRPLTTDELAMVRRQGGLIGQRVRSISQRFGPWGVLVRGTFTPRGGGYGVFGEGLTGLWRASLLDERLSPERDTLAERAVCIAGLAIDAQVTADEAAEYPDPPKVAGAWFIDDTTRMDDQQHALSALLMTVPILEAPPSVADSIHPAPTWLLWLIVVVAIANPLRVALGTQSRGPTERLRLTAAGCVAGSIVLLGVGALSGAVIGLVDSSRPAMRLGTASLCMLAAAIDLARPDPGSEPILHGWRAALVPVAFPLVVRPALLIAGWSVVADHSLGFYALGLAALTVLAALATFVPVIGHPLLKWSMINGVRLVAAIGFAASALLVAHAVFDL